MWEQGGLQPLPTFLFILGFPYQEPCVPTLDDRCNYNASGVVLNVGGNYNQGQDNGAFYLNGSNTASVTNANIGSHILKDIRHNNHG